jgi:NADP-dependent 3-hydroxy acid dehydrogenase YdfG
MSSSAPARLAQLEQHLTGSVKGLLAGQNAIITGGAQGIGAATAEIFAAAGASVVIADLDQGMFSCFLTPTGACII